MVHAGNLPLVSRVNKHELRFVSFPPVFPRGTGAISDGRTLMTMLTVYPVSCPISEW